MNDRFAKQKPQAFFLNRRGRLLDGALQASARTPVAPL